MTQWYHPRCASMKRPGPVLEALDAGTPLLDPAEAEDMLAIADVGAKHRRVPRIDGIQRSPNSRARCRNCLELIEKDTWRIRLVFFEQEAGMYNPAGYVHLSCSEEYFETTEILDRIAHFSDNLSDEDVEEIAGALGQSTDIRSTRTWHPRSNWISHSQPDHSSGFRAVQTSPTHHLYDGTTRPPPGSE